MDGGGIEILFQRHLRLLLTQFPQGIAFEAGARSHVQFVSPRIRHPSQGYGSAMTGAWTRRPSTGGPRCDESRFTMALDV